MVNIQQLDRTPFRYEALFVYTQVTYTLKPSFTSVNMNKGNLFLKEINGFMLNVAD